MAFDLAPVLNQVTGLIERQHVGRRGAAIGFLARLVRLLGLERTRPMDDPHVVLRIHRRTTIEQRASNLYEPSPCRHVQGSRPRGAGARINVRTCSY